MLHELGVPSRPIPTKRVCDLYDELKRDILTILAAKKHVAPHHRAKTSSGSRKRERSVQKVLANHLVPKTNDHGNGGALFRDRVAAKLHSSSSASGGSKTAGGGAKKTTSKKKVVLGPDGKPVKKQKKMTAAQQKKAAKAAKAAAAAVAKAAAASAAASAGGAVPAAGAAKVSDVAVSKTESRKRSRDEGSADGKGEKRIKSEPSATAPSTSTIDFGSIEPIPLED